MRLVRGLLGMCLGLALCLGFATTALAHAALVAADPADGSTLAHAPRTMVLQFDEPVTPTVFRLIDATGHSHDLGQPETDAEILRIVLPDDLPRGTQTVTYRIVSADGHPVGGTVMFSIGVPTAAGPATSPRSFSLRDVLIWLARIGVYVGLFVGIGGVLFGAWTAHRQVAGNYIKAALWTGIAAAVASFGLQGLDLLDLPFAAVLSSAPWIAAAKTSLCPSLLLAMAAMSLALWGQRCEAGQLAHMASLLATTCGGLSLAISGHAATASPQWLMQPAVFIHTIGVIYWVGALGPLAALTHYPRDELRLVVARFSRVAVVMVGLLVMTGLILAAVQLESFGALVYTAYGRILSAKVALVVLLLGLAAFNRLRLTPALGATPGAARSLERSILVECLAVAGILALVAGWRFTPPPRTLIAAMSAPLSRHLQSGDVTLDVTLAPGRIGTNTLRLRFATGTGRALPLKDVNVTLAEPDRGVAPMMRSVEHVGEGEWLARDVVLPFAGRWQVQVEAFVTDFEKRTFTTDFDLESRDSPFKNATKPPV